MTAPTITYGHGFLNDTWINITDDYTLTNGGSTAAAVADSNRNLAVGITAFVGDAYLTNDDNLGLSTATYTTFKTRYKTTSTAKAKIIATFSDATTQTLLSETASTSWADLSVTLTTAKTLDHLSFYCCDATGSAIFDFALVCKGTFTFPQYSRLNWSMKNRYNDTEVPSRVGRRKSWIGADETTVIIEGDVDSNRSGWSRSGDTVAAQVLNDIHHNASTEAWQYFTSDRGSFKAVMENLDLTESADQTYLYSFVTTLSEFSAVNMANYTVAERFKL